MGPGLSMTSSVATLSVSAPACASAPVIATQPASVSVVAPAGASFTVAEGTVPAGCSAASVQWKVSTDGGTTFSNVGSGGTSATLSVSPTATSESGNEYEAVLTNGSGLATTSHIATLTISTATNGHTPVVTHVLPNRGPAFSLVLIFGRHFNWATHVNFGSTRAVYLQLTDWLIIAVAPPQTSTGRVDVTVDTQNGASAVSSADRFRYDRSFPFLGFFFY